MKALSRKKVLAVFIDAGHTPSGNPKRGWEIFEMPKPGFDYSEYIGFVEQGYFGDRVLRLKFPNAVRLVCTFEVKHNQYRVASKNSL